MRYTDCLLLREEIDALDMERAREMQARVPNPALIQALKEEIDCLEGRYAAGRGEQIRSRFAG